MAARVFDLFHPAVALLYFAALLVLAMAAMHPVYVAVALLGSLAFEAASRGPRAMVRALAWQLPVIAVIALANCAFVSSGSTELFRIGSRAFYLEALLYGVCSGAMLSCVLLVFSNASRVLSSDKVMGVLGAVLPTVALMTSMTLRLVPHFARRGRTIHDAAGACTAVAAGPRRAAAGAGVSAGAESAGGEADSGGPRAKRTPRRRALGENLRLTTVLMGWAMEDALETADTIRARGWGAARRRSSYRRGRFRGLDALACALVGLLAVASAAAAWTACGRFSFYPLVAGWSPWWSYAPFVLLAAAPVLAGALVEGRGA